MISAWWVVSAIIVGAVFGIMMVAILSANRDE